MACGRRWWTSGEDQVAAAEEIIAAEAASAMAETASVMAVVIVASRVAWMPVRAHPCAHHCRARCYPSAETDPFAQTGLGRTDPFAETDRCSPQKIKSDILTTTSLRQEVETQER